MKRFIKKAVACTMALAMAVTPVVATTPTPAPNITGVGTLNVQPIQAQVPTNLNFTLDPLRAAGNQSQVGDHEFIMWNNSAMDLRVMVNVAFEAADGVTLVAAIPEDNRVSSGHLTNHIAMGILPSTDTDLTANTAYSVALTTAHFDPEFNRAEPSYLRPSVESTSAPGVWVSTVGFGLTPRVTTGNHAQTSTAAFQFSADMHGLATWVNNAAAVNVNAVIDLIPVAAAFNTTTGNFQGGTPTSSRLLSATHLPAVDANGANAVAVRLGLVPPAFAFGAMPDGVTAVGNALTVGRSRDLGDEISIPINSGVNLTVEGIAGDPDEFSIEGTGRNQYLVIDNTGGRSGTFTIVLDVDGGENVTLTLTMVR